MIARALVFASLLVASSVASANGGLISSAIVLASAALGAPTFVTFGLAIGLGIFQQIKAARKARREFNAGLKDRLIMSSTTDGARSVIYGRARNVDGVLFKATFGADKRFFRLVVAIAGHEVDAIETVYFDDVAVSLDGAGFVTTAPYATVTRKNEVETAPAVNGTMVIAHPPVSGSVDVTLTSGIDGNSDHVSSNVVGQTVTWTISDPLLNTAQVSYQWDSTRSFAKVTKYLGTAAQDLSAVLLVDHPGLVQSSDKFRGIALLDCVLEYSQDAYPSGLPSISAVVRGKRVADITQGGSPVVWSENSSLIARDWSLYPNGGGLDASEIDDQAIIVAANAGAVVSTFTLPSGPVNMPTYEAGIVIKLDESPESALDEIVESMAGKRGWAGGKLKLVAGAFVAPVLTITEDWITDASDISIQPAPPRGDLVNAYRVRYADREQAFVDVQAPMIAPASFIAADGQEYVREIDAAAITHVAHAQHVAGVLLRDARESLIVELPCNMRAWRIELFDNVLVTLDRFGWAAKQFEVLGWRFETASAIRLTLKETNASIWPVDASFDGLGASNNTSLPLPWQVSPVTGLSIASSVLTADGQVITRTVVSWSLHADAAIVESGSVEIQYAKLAVTPLSWSSIRERGDQTSTTIVGLDSRQGYVFRVRAETTLGVRSVWGTSEVHVIDDAPMTAWTGVSGRPKAYRVISVGFDSFVAGSFPTATGPSGQGKLGLSDADTGAVLVDFSRSYVVNVLSRSTGLLVSSQIFNVFSSAANAASMAALLDSLGNDSVVVIYAFDEPQSNRLTNGLDVAMYRCGASRAVFGSANFRFRSAYVLVGIPGMGEGQGAEAYSGAIDNDPNAWCDVSFSISPSGAVVASGAAATPKTISDYGFTGDLDATVGATLGVNVAGQVTSGNATTLIADQALPDPVINNSAVTQIRSVQTAAHSVTGSTQTVPNDGSWGEFASELILDTLTTSSTGRGDVVLWLSGKIDAFAATSDGSFVTGRFSSDPFDQVTVAYEQAVRVVRRVASVDTIIAEELHTNTTISKLTLSVVNDSPGAGVTVTYLLQFINRLREVGPPFSIEGFRSSLISMVHAAPALFVAVAEVKK